MRVVAWVCFCMALVGCAANHPKENSDCTRRVAFQRGRSDARHHGLGLASNPLPIIRRNPTWMCEVEAAQKIFTGIGTSQEEASTAAHSTCSSHLQASYCRKTECKENL